MPFHPSASPPHSPPLPLSLILTMILLLLLLHASPAAAHGKILVVRGDRGGNGTALGIRGAVVPGAGVNTKTETDTTVFSLGRGNCGQTQAGGPNRAAVGVPAAMALSGPVLPQISPGEAGFVEGTWLTVTSDGAGPLSALVDPAGVGDFDGLDVLSARVTLNIPGDRGNINRDDALAAEDARDEKEKGEAKGSQGAMVKNERARRKRASNIDVEAPFKIQMPKDLQCNGTVAGQDNVCMVKLVNASRAGPFGGCFAVQQLKNGTRERARRG